MLGLALFGATNLARLPVDFLLDITYPLIKLSIAWPGATPEDIDRNLADPIERQLAAVDGLDYLSSSAMEGLFQLDVTFRYGVDVDTAYQDVLAAFARAQRDLPDDIEPAIIIKANPSQLPVVQVAFESSRMDLTQLRTWIDNWLTDRLLAADGVAGIDVAGGLKREIRVLIDHVALEKYGLSLAQIERRLSEENLTRLGGRVTGGNQETIVRTLGEYTDLETIRDILIARTDTGRLRLRDIARVEDGHEEMRIITRLRREQPTAPMAEVALAVQFNSLRLPFVVFLAAPFCVAGIGYALWLGGQPFGATVIIAVMVVLATNVNDGVLLIETTQRLRAEGMERLAATREAAELRLRPRLMITLSVSLGFVPLAFAFEPGGDLLRPLAIAAIGGLIAAVLVALYLVRCSMR